MAFFVLLSLLAHLLVMSVLMLSGPRTFSAPVQPRSAILVTFKSADATPLLKIGRAEPDATTRYQQGAPHHSKGGVKAENSAQEVRSPKNFTQTQEPSFVDDPAKASSLSPGEQNPLATSGKTQEIAMSEDANRNNYSDSHIPLAIDYERDKSPVRRAEEFLTTKKEKLTYRISLLKIPVAFQIQYPIMVSTRLFVRPASHLNYCGKVLETYLGKKGYRNRMPHAWEGIGKKPLTLVREELTKRYIQAREIDAHFLNYSIFVDVDENEQDLTTGVLYNNNSLFFMVDLQIECPDDIEILANVAEISYNLYLREEPFYGRILISEGSTYYQLCHILGPNGILDPTMVSYLLDLVQKEVLEIIDERYSQEIIPTVV